MSENSSIADGGWTAAELAAALQAAREAVVDPTAPPSRKSSALARYGAITSQVLREAS